MASSSREHQSIVGIPTAQATFLQKRKLVLGCWFPEFRRDLRTTMQFGNMRIVLCIFSARDNPDPEMRVVNFCPKWVGLESWQLMSDDLGL
ncbi:hypothetical protein AAEP93_000136 [Penicillium crustosum]